MWGYLLWVPQSWPPWNSVFSTNCEFFWEGFEFPRLIRTISIGSCVLNFGFCVLFTSSTRAQRLVCTGSHPAAFVVQTCTWQGPTACNVSWRPNLLDLKLDENIYHVSHATVLFGFTDHSFCMVLFFLIAFPCFGHDPPPSRPGSKSLPRLVQLWAESSHMAWSKLRGASVTARTSMQTSRQRDAIVVVSGGKKPRLYYICQCDGAVSHSCSKAFCSR